MLTGDALYCQQVLCMQAVEAGGDYLLLVKENQPTLLADIQQLFAPLTTEEQARTGVHTMHPLPIQIYRTVEKGHRRLEERQIRVSSELAGYSWWPYLEQVFEYTRTWTSNGVTQQQVRYGITSLPAEVSDAARLAALKRGRWQVENALHYVKDVILGEDASQTHVGNGADVLAMVRAFLLAGAPALIATLWRVDERSTRILIDRFYQEVLAEIDFAEALKRAQLYLMRLTRQEAEKILVHLLTEDLLDPASMPIADAQSYPPLLALEYGRAYLKHLPTTGGEAGALAGDPDDRIFADPYFWAPFILIDAHGSD